MTSPSLQTLLRRLEAVEARLTDIEGGYSQTMYRLHRRAVRTDLAVGRILAHLGVDAPTEDEIDAVMDEG
jgi:hypothetical protein